MNVEAALKAIIVLLAIMILSVALIFILMTQKGDGGSDNPPVPESTPPQTTTTVPPISTPSQTTKPETTLPETTFPETTLPETSAPETSVPDTEPPVTSEPEPIPPETSEPDPSLAPSDYLMNMTLRSNSGAKINTRIDLTATATEDGRVKVVAKLYLEHYSLSLSKRTGCIFNLGSSKNTFTVNAISHSGGKTNTLIYTFEGVFEYGSTLELYASYPCRCTYSGVRVESLDISGAIILE